MPRTAFVDMTTAIDDETTTAAPSGFATTAMARLFAVRSACRSFLARPPTRGKLQRLARSLRATYDASVVAIATSRDRLALPSRALKPHWHLATARLGERASASPVVVLSGAELAEITRNPSMHSAVVVPISTPTTHDRGVLLFGFAHPAIVDDDERMALAMIGQELAAALDAAAASFVQSSRARGEAIHASRDVAPETTTPIVKDEFLALVAHELRTPLTPMTMLLQLIEKKARSGVVDLDAIGRARKQVVRLTKLVGDLLDNARLEPHPTAATPQRVEMGALVSGVVRAFRATSQRHRFSLSLPPEPIHVLGDPARLEHVFANLLDNAVKFSPRGGEVRVEAFCTTTHVRIEVCDEGIGIPESQRHLVFERLFRASNVSSDNFRGLGLGLCVAHAIVRDHGGSMEVASQVGRGSRFTVTLPMAEPHAREAGGLRANRVLLVDDDPDIVDALAEILRTEGFDVVTAHDGTEALTQIETSRPDLLLLDLMMPTINGWEVLGHLRAREGTRRIPVIVLSAHATPSARADAYPIDAFLAKPFDVQALVQKMRELLGAAGSSPKRRGFRRPRSARKGGAISELARPTPRK